MGKWEAELVVEPKGASAHATPSLLFYPCSSRAPFRTGKENLGGKTETNPKTKTCKGNGKAIRKLSKIENETKKTSGMRSELPKL